MGATVPARMCSGRAACVDAERGTVSLPTRVCRSWSIAGASDLPGVLRGGAGAHYVLRYPRGVSCRIGADGAPPGGARRLRPADARWLDPKLLSAAVLVYEMVRH